MSITTAEIIHLYTKESKFAGLRKWYILATTVMQTFSHDLSNRQMAILLTVYLEPGVHTVKSLAAALKISKPAICRALDTMSGQNLIRRRRMESDKRQVYITRTMSGSVFLSELDELTKSLT